MLTERCPECSALLLLDDAVIECPSCGAVMRVLTFDPVIWPSDPSALELVSEASPERKEMVAAGLREKVKLLHGLHKSSKEETPTQSLAKLCKYVGGIIVVIFFPASRFLKGELHSLAYMVGLLGLCLAIYGRFFSPEDAIEILEDDTRPPILYLRSFSSENQFIIRRLIKSLLWRGGRLFSKDVYVPEVILREAFQSFGPLVALGKPNEKIVPPGAYRMYMSEDGWQAAIKSLINSAQLVVVQLGQTANLWWEINQVINTVGPQRLLFLIPAEWIKQTRCPGYEDFRNAINKLLPWPLPEYIGDSRFIWFDASGRPMLLGHAHVSLRTYLRGIMFKQRFKSFILIDEALRPVYEYLVSSTYPIYMTRRD